MENLTRNLKYITPTWKNRKYMISIPDEITFNRDERAKYIAKEVHCRTGTAYYLDRTYKLFEELLESHRCVDDFYNYIRRNEVFEITNLKGEKIYVRFKQGEIFISDKRMKAIMNELSRHPNFTEDIDSCKIRAVDEPIF
jgi:hypothetical protein